LATVAQPFIERFQSGIGMNGEGVTDLWTSAVAWKRFINLLENSIKRRSACDSRCKPFPLV